MIEGNICGDVRDGGEPLSLVKYCTYPDPSATAFVSQGIINE